MDGGLSLPLRMALGFACAMVAVGLVLPKKFVHQDGPVFATPAAGTAAPSTTTPRAAPLRSGTVVIDADRLGQFHTDAQIEGRFVRMLVDTGASAVALSADTAADMGIHPFPADYRVPVSTANGTVMAATVRLHEIRIGSITARDVVALVAPPGQATPDLLGMTFLRTLRHFEISGQRLVLEQ